MRGGGGRTNNSIDCVNWAIVRRLSSCQWRVMTDPVTRCPPPPPGDINWWSRKQILYCRDGREQLDLEWIRKVTPHPPILQPPATLSSPDLV